MILICFLIGLCKATFMSCGFRLTKKIHSYILRNKSLCHLNSYRGFPSPLSPCL